MTVTLLDGGMGQELIHRSNFPLSPLWSAKVLLDEPEIVEAVHCDYIAAGADIITLNSYSLTPERLARDASEDLFEKLQMRAIEIAKRAIANSHTRLAGCLPPLYGSYHPENAPDFEIAIATYRRIVECQENAVDLFLCETMSSLKEAVSATKAASESGKAVWCSLSVKEDDGSRLRSGESLVDGACAALEAGADAVLINCSPPEAVTDGLNILADMSLPFGAYANGFIKADNLEIGGTVDCLETRTDLNPSAYANFVDDWIQKGAMVVGGCCEVGPAHIAALRQRIDV